MKKELEKLEFAEGYSKIGELKEGLEKFFFPVETIRQCAILIAAN